jgi:protein-L-isoaspartate O-methyltransferase
MQRSVLAVAASLALLVSTTAFGQAEPVQVMVLGTYHMDNPGQDLVNVRAADVLTPQRQAELAAVAEALTKFKPTVVAVERVTAAPGYVDENYARFKDADLAAKRDERVQIGYRVARAAGLSAVHGIDEQPSAGEPDYFPFDKMQASAHARGQDAALASLLEQAGRMVAEFGATQEKSTVARLLRAANDEHGLADPSFYYSLLNLDVGEDQAGAELVGYWYMRNAKIVAKLCDVVRRGDRVLVLFGAGHKHWIEQIVRGMPGMQVVDTAQYLPVQ